MHAENCTNKIPPVLYNHQLAEHAVSLTFTTTHPHTHTHTSLQNFMLFRLLILFWDTICSHSAVQVFTLHKMGWVKYYDEDEQNGLSGHLDILPLTITKRQ